MTRRRMGWGSSLGTNDSIWRDWFFYCCLGAMALALGNVVFVVWLLA